ncbi:MAG: hypothetical protein NXI27_12530 [Alphaproteobacteria bacterium]|nr:hypothetical protein [Alphaproteobacteria bacterium]
MVRGNTSFGQQILFGRLTLKVHRWLVALLLVGLTGPVKAAESVYTKIEFPTCVGLSSDDQGGHLHCPGHGGYAVVFKEGDLRQAVQFGHVAQGDVFESFGAFNRVNDTIEWRLDEDGIPVAAILRWFLENPDPKTGSPSPQSTGQVLVISRVGQPGNAHSCVIGYVDALANSNANVLARNVADTMAVNFVCGGGTPIFHGDRGPLATDPSRFYPPQEE